MTHEEFIAKHERERKEEALRHLRAEADRLTREHLEADAYVRLRRLHPLENYAAICARARAEVSATLSGTKAGTDDRSHHENTTENHPSVASLDSTRGRSDVSVESFGLRAQPAGSVQAVICDDCEKPTDWQYAVQTDPWYFPTGEILCENCAEKRWDRYQEKLMEET